MILDTINRKIQAVLDAAPAATQPVCVVDWVDITTTTMTPGFTPTTLNGVTAVDILAAPAASTQRKVNYLSLYNPDTSAVAVTVRYNDNATLYTIVKINLLPGETLYWTDPEGWAVLDSTGVVKMGPATAGRYLRTRVFSSGTSFVVSPDCNTIHVRLHAGGGGGGACTTAVTNSAAAGGGASGGFAEKTAAVTPGATVTYTIGGGGGSAAAGGNSTIVLGGVTVTANGGPAGASQTVAAPPLVSLGGAAPAVSTNGDINGTGAPGQGGSCASATIAISGQGGDSRLGGAGNARTTQGNGNAATGFGAGGGGACILSGGASTTGGAGSGGLLIVEEFS